MDRWIEHCVNLYMVITQHMRVFNQYKQPSFKESLTHFIYAVLKHSYIS